MQAEGFSGIDGRTSIFDYCGVPAIQAWSNKGKWDGKWLDDEQHELREFYTTLLNVATKEKALSEGIMYDLEYAQADGFNRHEHYAYIRHYTPPAQQHKAGRPKAVPEKEETVLAVLNFDDKQAQIHVRIPQEAFDHLGITPKDDEVLFTDLLTGTEYRGAFCPDRPFVITLPAWKGALLKAEL